jgi:predicted NUDIX family NTP pyrophosphohydrolase
MASTSAGLLLYRYREGVIEVLIVHPGGPFFRRRDEGAWSIPKGECSARETDLQVALREFEEELGTPPPQPPFASLGSLRQAGGKSVYAWAARGEFDVEHLNSNTFELEWPPRSGRLHRFPEVDRAGWFGIAAAGRKILAAQRPFLNRLMAVVPHEPEYPAPQR